MFSTDVDDYFVEPLWNHSSSAGRAAGQPYPHIVYSRTSIKNTELHTYCGVSGTNGYPPLEHRGR